MLCHYRTEPNNNLIKTDNDMATAKRINQFQSFSSAKTCSISFFVVSSRKLTVFGSGTTIVRRMNKGLFAFQKTMILLLIIGKAA